MFLARGEEARIARNRNENSKVLLPSEKELYGANNL
jgi:hypothetical protein